MIGIDDSVHAEVSIIRLVCKVAPVGEVVILSIRAGLAVGVWLPQALIDPIPNAPSNQARVLVEGVDVLL